MKIFNNTFITHIFLLLSFSCLSAQDFKWGLAARQGDRPTMEDEHTREVKAHDAFFAVFDGHGGADAAHYAQKNLHNHFFNLAQPNTGKTEENLIKAFLQTDNEILKDIDSGAVAVAVYMTGKNGGTHKDEQAYIAWAGDSRAVIVRKGKVIFATTDHKPNHPEERARIESCGLQVQHYGVHRILGLAISRTLGDREVKEFSRGAVTATPQTHQLAIRPGDLIILACDGVWDVLSNEDAANIVSDVVSGKKSLADVGKVFPLVPKNRCGKCEQFINYSDDHVLQTAARALRDEAYTKGSTDNISAMVVQYKPQQNGDELKEGKQEVKETQAATATLQRQTIMARLRELHEVAEENKIPRAATNAQNALVLLQAEAYTHDVLMSVQEFVNSINGNLKIRYVDQQTTLKTLLDPIKDDISREIRKLRKQAIRQ